MRRKHSFAKTFFATLAVCSLMVSSCSSDDGGNHQQQQTDQRYEIYLLAVGDGYEGTYEEWLNSIKGVGIETIAKTATNGNVDTYTIYYTNGQVTTFTVTNGVAEGQVGPGGHTPEITIGDNGNWFVDGVDTNVKAQGPQGEPGRGITQIVKTSTDGNVDTYTIYYSDNTTSTFTVTNGVDGESIQGEKGEDGHTPEITISFDGYWIIDGVKTEFIARGPQGEPGRGITEIVKTSTSGNVDTYTIYYSDNSTSTFTVTNGVAEGGGGSTVSISEDGYWVIDGVKTEFKATGTDGISIVSISYTSSEGLVDTYTITYSDNHTSTFTVTNGSNGAQGIQGEKGEDGHTPVISVNEDGYWVVDGVSTGIKAQGPQGPVGPQGPAGVGILSIEKTGEDGKTDIYTITYTDGHTSTFNVKNGEDGVTTIIHEGGEGGGTSSVTIQDGYWYIDGVNTGIKAEGSQGPQGPAGNGISSITYTSSDGNVDTYTISFTNGGSATFTVTNGVDGAQGTQGIQGEPGEDGHTPVITVNEDGYWVVDGVSTGIKAQGPTGPVGPQGPQGEQGVSIEKIEKTSTVGLVDTYTITYSDGTTSTFTVTNGAQGPQGIQGEAGEDGHTPVITLSEDGFWVIDGVKTEIKAQGKSAYELYCDAHPEYQGDEDQWLDDLVNGRLGTDEYYTVTFDSQGGSAVAPQVIRRGDKASKPENPTKPGYTFGGWTYQGEPWVFYGYSITEDITLTATWVAEKYTVTFKNYDGTVLQTVQDVNYGDEVTYEGETPTKPGHDRYTYAFDGWDQSLVITGDTVLTAQFAELFEAFTVRYLDSEGQILFETLSSSEQIPAYVGETPTKEADESLQYQFDHWADPVGLGGDIVTISPIFVSCTAGLVFENNAVTGYTGTSKDVVVPSKWNGHDITSIAASAFRYNTTIETVELPDSITYIGSSAFESASNLHIANIPSSVATIENNAFRSNRYDSAILVEAESSQTGWAANAFYNGYVVYGYVDLYEDSGDVYALTEISGVKSAKMISFVQSKSTFAPLTMISGQYTVSDVNWALVKTADVRTNLRNINIPGGIKTIPAQTFYNSSFNIESLVLNEGIETIGNDAFRCFNCSRIDIVIPSTVTSVGSYAFYNNLNGGKLVLLCKSESKPNNWSEYFYGTHAYGSSYVVWGYVGQQVFSNVTYALSEISGQKYAHVIGINPTETFFIPMSVIDGYTVCGVYWQLLQTAEVRENLEFISIPAGIKDIPASAFNNSNYHVQTLILAEGVETIGQDAFRCFSGAHIVILIPSTVTSVGSYAFYNNLNGGSIVVVAKAESKPNGWNANFYGASNGASDVVWGYESFTVQGGLYYALCEVDSHKYAYVYNIDENTINSITSLNILAEYDGYTTTGVFWKLFKNNATLQANITSIIIPGGIASIDVESLFRGYNNVTSIILNEGLEYIANYAFDYLDLVTSVVIPSTVNYIGTGAFEHHSGYKFIFLCKAESQPEGWSNSFAGGQGITDVVWGYKSTYTDNKLNYALCEVGGVKTAVVIGVADETQTTFAPLAEIDGHTTTRILWNYLKYNASFVGGLTTVVIPDGVTEIDAYAFYYASYGSPTTALSNMTTLVLGSGLESIGEGAFNGCNALTIVIVPNSVTALGNNAFYHSDGHLVILCEAESKPAGWSDYFDGKGGSNTYVDVVWGYKSTYTDNKLNYALCEVGGVKTAVVIGVADETQTTFAPLAEIDGHTTTRILWNYLKYNASFVGGLTTVVIPDGVTEIDAYAFYYYSYGSPETKLSNLTTLILNEGLVSIGEGAFYGCNALTTVIVPNSVTSLGNHAFYHSDGHLVILCEAESKPAGWSDYFDGKGGSNTYVDVVWGFVDTASVDGLEYALCEIGGVKTAIVYKINDLTMKTFNVVSSVDGYTVTDIVWNMSLYHTTFFGSIQTMVLPGTIKNIPANAFYKIYTVSLGSLTSLTLGEGIESIGSNAFYGCDSLISVIIPASVTTIGADAFYHTIYGGNYFVHCVAASKPDGWSSSFAGPSNKVTIDYGYEPE